MSFLDWLFTKTPDDLDEAPRPTAVVIGSLPPTDDDEPAQATMQELEPVLTIIDYIDSTGGKSRRRITMRALLPTGNGPMLRAVCHERKAVRCFRCDRIQCFIEPDGEVIETQAFFRDIMAIDLASYRASAADVSTDRARAARDALRPALSILVAMARSDDEFHVSELRTIAQFAAREVDALRAEGRLHLTLEERDNWALSNLIGRMRPTRQALRGYLATALEWHPARLRRLEDAIASVIRADGQESIEELDLMNELSAMKHQLERGMW
jgi:hypothetical protein